MPNVYYVMKSPIPKAIVNWCNDARIQTAVREFLEAEHGLFDGDYIALSTTGGPGRLLHPFVSRSDYDCMMSQIMLHLEESKCINQVICIGHEDCKWYKRIVASSRFWRGHLGADPEQAARNALCQDINPGITQVQADLEKFGVGLTRYFGEFAGPTREEMHFHRSI